MQVETTKYGEDTISFGWGNVYIFGGDAQASLEVIGADGGDGTVYGIADSGQAAISANNIYISIYKFIASGGDGGDGAQGEKGAAAKDYTYIGEPGNPGKAGENGFSSILIAKISEYPRAYTRTRSCIKDKHTSHRQMHYKTQSRQKLSTLKIFFNFLLSSPFLDKTAGNFKIFPLPILPSAPDRRPVHFQ